MKIYHLEVLVMDNKEIICNGKTLGYAEGEMAMYLRDCERVIEIQAEVDNYETD